MERLTRKRCLFTQQTSSPHTFPPEKKKPGRKNHQKKNLFVMFITFVKFFFSVTKLADILGVYIPRGELVCTQGRRSRLR